MSVQYSQCTDYTNQLLASVLLAAGFKFLPDRRKTNVTAECLDPSYKQPATENTVITLAVM